MLMQIRTERYSHFTIPALLWLIPLAGLFTLLIQWLFRQLFGFSMPVCFFKYFTGHPCVICGGTRATMALMRGDVIKALQWNPLFTIALVVVMTVLLIELASQRRFVIKFKSKKEKIVIYAITILVIMANWVYLWLVGR